MENCSRKKFWLAREKSNENLDVNDLDKNVTQDITSRTCSTS
jgi:hypothetical protein